MGIFGDILEVVTDVEEKVRPTLRGLATPEKFLFRGGGLPEPAESDIDDVLAAILRGKSEDVLTLARSVQTTEDLLALDQARAELVELGTQLPVMREKIGLLETLPEFDEDTTAEEMLSAYAEELPKLAIEGVEETVALSPEEQAFADLQTRSMGLDVELKEQQLASEKMANRQAGMMSLLNMLPASARASTIATIMETPTLRDELFPGLFGGAGGAAAPGGTAEGDVIDILTQFGGGE